MHYKATAPKPKAKAASVTKPMKSMKKAKAMKAKAANVMNARDFSRPCVFFRQCSGDYRFFFSREWRGDYIYSWGVVNA